MYDTMRRKYISLSSFDPDESCVTPSTAYNVPPYKVSHVANPAGDNGKVYS